jgi:hypothetical protein
LIIACAGMNSPLAISAAILLILFHAISKALLFLSVGVIEQQIHSRNIEDMRDVSSALAGDDDCDADRHLHDAVCRLRCADCQVGRHRGGGECCRWRC